MTRTDRNASRRDALTHPLSASSGAVTEMRHYYLACDASGTMCVYENGVGLVHRLLDAESAINHHDKLVSALRELTESADAIATAENFNALDDQIAAARAILAEVEEK